MSGLRMRVGSSALSAAVLAASSLVLLAVPVAGAVGPTTVSGVVSDAATGQPIEGVDVDIVIGSSLEPGSVNVASTVTDATGGFSVDLSAVAGASDPVTIDLVDPAGSFGVSYANPVTLVDDDTVFTSFALDPGATVSGTVTGAGAGPIAGSCVTVRDTTTALVLPSGLPGGCSDASGAYTLPALAAGTYTLTFSSPAAELWNSIPAQQVTVDAGVPALADAVLLPVRETSITGVVTEFGTGTPLAGMDLTATTSDADGNPQTLSATTDDTGAFTLAIGFQPGAPFVIDVVDPTGAHHPASGITISVQAGYTEAIGVTLQPSDLLPTTNVVLPVGSTVIIDGQPGVAAIVVRNDGPTAATDVVVTSTLPPFATAGDVQAPPGFVCSVAGQVVTCSTPVLGVQRAATIRIPLVTGPSPLFGFISSVATTSSIETNAFDNNASHFVSVQPDRADVRVLLDARPLEVGVSAPLTLGVFNFGPSTARDVFAAARFPAGVTIDRVESPGWTCAIDGQEVGCSASSLAPEAGALEALVYVTPPSLATGLPVSAIAGIAGVGTDAVDTVFDVVPVGSVDLNVFAFPVFRSPVVGRVMTLDFGISNIGPAAATNVVFATDIPEGLEVVSAVDSSGALSCAIDGQHVECTASTYPRNANGRIRIGVRPAAPGGPFSVTATLTSDSVDIGTQPDSATLPDFVVIQDESDLSVSIFAPALAVGETGTVSINVGNVGPGIATDVEVSATVPEGFAIVSASPSFFGAMCTIASRSVTCRFPELFPNGFPFTLVQLGVRPEAAASGEMTASVSSASADPNPADNTATGTLNALAPGADLRVSVGTFGSPMVGQNGSMFVTVNNDGPSFATGTTVTVSVPEPFRLVSSGFGPACSITDHIATCDVGGMPPSSATSIFLTFVADAAGQVPVTATVSSLTPDPDLSDNEASTVLVATAPFADLGVFPPAPSPVVAGESNERTFAVQNASFEIARDVLVTVTSSGATLRAIDAPGFTCSVDPDGIGRCSADSFGGFQFSAATVSFVPDGGGAQVVLDAVVAASTPDPFAFNNTASARFDVLPAGSADLAAQFSPGFAEFTIGVDREVLIGVHNFGPSRVAAATFVFTAGSAFEILDVAADAGVVCTTASSTITCIASDLGPNAGAGASVTLRPVSEAFFGNVLSVDVSGATVDTNPFNDQQSSFVSIVRNESDLSVSLFGPTYATVDESATFSLQVFNNGPAMATDTTVEVAIPPSLQFVGASGFTPCSETSPGTVVCSFGALARFGGQVVGLQLLGVAPSTGVTVTAVARSATPDPTDFNNSAMSVVSVAPAGAVDIAVGVGPVQMLVGQSDNLAVTLGTLGPGAAVATDIRVVATYPDALRIDAATTPFDEAGECTVTGQTVECFLPTMLPSTAIFVRVTPLFPTAGEPVTASVSTSAFDPDPSNNESTASIEIIPDEADMVLVGGSEPAPLNVGQQTENLSLFVSNDGIAPARNATVRLEPEAGLEITFAFAFFGQCAPDGTAWSCSFTMPPGAGAVVFYSVRAAEVGSHSVTLTTTADNDIDPSNNTSSIVIDVYPEGSSNLGVTMSVSQIDELGTTAVTVDVSPGGPAPEAREVTLNVAIPGLAATEPIDVRDLFGNPVGTCAAGVETVTCTFDAIASFDRRSLAFFATAVRPVRGAQVVATVASPFFDPDPTFNTATSEMYDLLVPPGAPTQPVGVPRDGFVFLEWGFPPATGSLGIIDWVVEYSSDGGVTWSLFDVTSSPEAPSTTVTGLRNGRTYVFRVAAVNVFGQGDWSEVSAPVTPSLPPRAPERLQASGGRQQVTLTWRAPNQRGRSPVTDYVIQYSTDRGRTWITYEDGESTATRVTVTGLANNTRYTFRVAAVNLSGQGAFSETESATTSRR